MCSTNFHGQYDLETIPEVPIPYEMFTNMVMNGDPWENMGLLMSFQSSVEATEEELMALLRLLMSPLVPIQVQLDHVLTCPISDISDFPIEASMAKYIVQQYIAAAGGEAGLNSYDTMCAVGELNLIALDMHHSDYNVHGGCNSEVGGFVLWQQNPNSWYLEMVVSGFKVSTGCDGMVSWYQSSLQPDNADRGPPRPLRRFFQGLDPRFTANLFSKALYIGEKSIDGQKCFILKLQTDPSTLEAQNSPVIETISHSIWGYFSQRTGLLVQFEDTMLLKVKAVEGNDKVYWGTSMVSVLEDYAFTDDVNIAHSGKTTTELFGYGEAHNHKWKIVESWNINNVDFNFEGLSAESFMPPPDPESEQHGEQESVFEF